jgi:dUTP pyrophosphatase
MTIRFLCEVLILGVALISAIVVVERIWDDWLMFQHERFAIIREERSVAFEAKRLSLDAQLPSKKRFTDAAWDIYAAEDCVVTASSLAKIGTGLAISPPEGWYFTINGRSGMTSKGITVLRGIIDTGYTGEVGIVIANLTTQDYQIKKGDRIGQLTPHKTYDAMFKEVTDFSPRYRLRGTDGWGSSGS